MVHGLFYKIKIQLLLMVGIFWITNSAPTGRSSLEDKQLLDEIQMNMIDLDKDFTEEAYYQLVLKVKQAVSRGLLTMKLHTREYQGETSTDLYYVNGYRQEIKLPSTDYAPLAEEYFKNHEIKAPHKDWLPIIETDDFLRDPVRSMRIDMAQFPLDQAPGEKYYTLVLKVAEAVDARYIARTDSLKTKGEGGMYFELYKVRVNSDVVVLPSVDDLGKAMEYFKKANRRYTPIPGGHTQDEHLPRSPNYYTDDEKEEILEHLIDHQENEYRHQIHNSPFQSMQNIKSIDNDASDFIQRMRKHLGLQPSETPQTLTNRKTNDFGKNTGDETPRTPTNRNTNDFSKNTADETPQTPTNRKSNDFRNNTAFRAKNNRFPSDVMEKNKRGPKRVIEWFRRRFRRKH